MRFSDTYTQNRDKAVYFEEGDARTNKDPSYNRI